MAETRIQKSVAHRRPAVLIMVLLWIAITSLTAPAALAAPAAEAITVSGFHEVAVGKSIRLTAAIQPAEARQDIAWKSSNENIATVSSDGRVKGISAGKVKITASAALNPKVKKTFIVTVLKRAVQKISITAETKKLDLNDRKTVTLKAEARPSSASQTFAWKSSDPNVVKVDQKGVATAVRVGKATVTVSATDGSRVKKEIVLTVEDSTPQPEQPRYYALLIGNGYGYAEGLDQQLTDAPDVIRTMRLMLKGLNQDWHITLRDDQTAAGIISSIRTAFKNARENDICLFFYSGHGVSDEEAPAVYDAEQGGLVGVDDNTVSGERLASTLKSACLGKVLVILDSCGSGAMILQKDGTAADPASEAWRFIRQMNGAFARHNGNSGEKTGELRQGKFTVLTACEYRDLGDNHEFPEGRCSTFSYYLFKSAGVTFKSGAYSGSMPADSNGDGQLTLGEIYPWVYSEVVHSSGQKVQKYGDYSTVFFTR